MARRPTPTAIKKLAGNAGHRPLNDSEPEPETAAPEMPKGMGKAARREWSRIVPQLLQLGVLSRIDGKALAAYCDAYALWEQARKEIVKYGMVLRAPKCDKDGAVIIVNMEKGDYVPADEIMVKHVGDTVLRGRIIYEHKANPACAIYEHMAKLMKSFLIEFGLTPASRSKLKIDKPAGKNEEAEEAFLRGPQSVAQVKQAAAVQFDTGKTGTPNAPAQKVRVPDISATDFDA